MAEPSVHGRINSVFRQRTRTRFMHGIHLERESGGTPGQFKPRTVRKSVFEEEVSASGSDRL